MLGLSVQLEYKLHSNWITSRQDDALLSIQHARPIVKRLHFIHPRTNHTDAVIIPFLAASGSDCHSQLSQIFHRKSCRSRSTPSQPRHHFAHQNLAIALISMDYLAMPQCNAIFMCIICNAISSRRANKKLHIQLSLYTCLIKRKCIYLLQNHYSNWNFNAYLLDLVKNSEKQVHFQFNWNYRK